MLVAEAGVDPVGATVEDPAYWAQGPEMNSIATEDEFGQGTARAGFVVEEMTTGASTPPPPPPPAPGLHSGVVMGIADLGEAGANTACGIDRGTILIATALLSEPAR